MSEPGTRAPIVVTHAGGAKFAAQIRRHRVMVDQTARGGGEDTAPTPLELLGAALGTCIALYVEQFCTSRGIAHEGMRVEVESHSAANPHRIGTFVVRVVMPTELPERTMNLLERVARSCPVHHTLEDGAEVQFHTETPVAAWAGT
jgi:putative redox protein